MKPIDTTELLRLAMAIKDARAQFDLLLSTDYGDVTKEMYQKAELDMDTAAFKLVEFLRDQGD